MPTADAHPSHVMASLAHPNHASPSAADLKRKRSPSSSSAHDHHHHHLSAAPLPKAQKTANHLQINYLARQVQTDLPLLTNDDTLPSILSLLGDYQGVLDRHESMACNLGARPLGPILIKRFERLFDGPPRVLKSHGKDGTLITWLDVVEFARNKPEQFQLGQMSEGVRVCQFYTKQCRVQISEEDFVLISSGIPQKMIPPQPIVEDEEKELGTIEILEKNLGQICQLADQVAARTRQLNHRLKGRKQAILDRRSSAPPPAPLRPSSPSNVALMNGTPPLPAHVSHPHTAPPPTAGFVAVNARPQAHGEVGASPSARHDLMSKSHTVGGSRSSFAPAANGAPDARRSSLGTPIFQQYGPLLAQPQTSTPAPSHASKQIPHPPSPTAMAPHQARDMEQVMAAVARLPHMSEPDLHAAMASPVPIPNTPSSLLPAAAQRTSQPPQADKDDGGPYKTEMIQRMDALGKGDRILPPCDRCRRLHMDCLKNLTACMGCTKKHAKCAWREVREGEMQRSGTANLGIPYEGPRHHDAASAPHAATGGSASTGSNGTHSESEDGMSVSARDAKAQLDRASTGSPAVPPAPLQRHTATPVQQPQQPAPQPAPRPHDHNGISSFTPANAAPEARMIASLRHPSPPSPFIDRERDRAQDREKERDSERSAASVEEQLQEAAKSGLAHAHAHARAVFGGAMAGDANGPASGPGPGAGPGPGKEFMGVVA